PDAPLPTLKYVLWQATAGLADPRPRFAVPVKPPPDVTLQTIRPGLLLEGRVTRAVPFGVFVDVGLGGEALVPIPHLSDRPGVDPATVAPVGAVIHGRVLEVDVPKRRITLSLRSEREERREGPPRGRAPRAPRRGDGPPRREPVPAGAGGAGFPRGPDAAAAGAGGEVPRGESPRGAAVRSRRGCWGRGSSGRSSRPRRARGRRARALRRRRPRRGSTGRSSTARGSRCAAARCGSSGTSP